MVEGLLQESGNIRPAPEMIAVTAAAGGGRDARDPTVKALAELEVLADFLVADETQLLLGPGLEGLMAAAALLLDLRVSFDHRAGHDEGSQVHREDASWEERGEHEAGDGSTSQQVERSSCSGQVPNQVAGHDQYMWTATMWTVAVAKRRKQSGRWITCQSAKKRS